MSFVYKYIMWEVIENLRLYAIGRFSLEAVILNIAEDLLKLYIHLLLI